MNFAFQTAGQVLFGRGVVKKLIPTAKSLGLLGKKALIVQARPSSVPEIFDKAGVKYVSYSVQTEPTTTVVDQGAELARAEKVDFVVGVGGGSVIDTAKAIAMLVTNGGQSLDYMEVIGAGKPIRVPSLPIIAVPTTAGTGAEVTKNAVVTSEQHKQKASLRSEFMMPNLAVVDPELTASAPPAVTAATGLDAFTQCLEPFTSCNATPITDALALRGLEVGAQSIRRAYTNGDDMNAREGMAFCSLIGGIALANAKLGAVHGFAGPLGGLLKDAAHGAICAALLPHVVRANVAALQEREPNNPALQKFTIAARVVTGKPNATPSDLAAWIQETCDLLKIPSLQKMGLREEDFEDIVKKSADASSMKGNPLKLTNAELTTILRQATGAPKAKL